MTDQPLHVLSQPGHTSPPHHKLHDAGATLLVLKALADADDPRDAFNELPPGAAFRARAVAEGMVDYLMDANRFSVQDRRKLVRIMGVEVDPTDARKFYEVYLDRVEARPHAAVALEMELYKGEPKHKVSRKLTKKPVGALSMGLSPLTDDQLGRLKVALLSETSVPADIAVGTMLAHGLLSFRVLFEENRIPNKAQRALEKQRALLGDDEEDLAGVEIDIKSDNVKDRGAIASIVLATDIDELLSSEPVSDTFYDACALLEAVAQSLEPGDPADAFDAAMRLVNALPSLAKVAQECPRIEELASRLAPLVGLSVEDVAKSLRMQYPDEAEELVATIDAHAARADELSDAILDNKTAAAKALDADDFDRLNTVAAEGQKAKAALEAVEAGRARSLSALKALFDTGQGSNDPQWGQQEDQNVVDTAIDLGPDVELADEPIQNEAKEATPPPTENGAKPDFDTTLDDGYPNKANANAPTAPAKPTDQPLVEPAQRQKNELAQATQGTADPRSLASGKAIGDLLSESDDEIALQAELIEGDALNVAARIAPVCTGARVLEDVLQIADHSRSFETDPTPEVQALSAVVLRAAQNPLTDDAAALLFAAAMHTAVFVPYAGVRDTMSGLSLGDFGGALGSLQSTVAQLPHDFPPSPEDLARLSGTLREPRRKRLVRDLEAWRESAQSKAGPCHQSGRVLRDLVKSSGSVGAAIDAVSANVPAAEVLVADIVARFKTLDDMVAALREEFPDLVIGSGIRMPRISHDYLYRNLTGAVRLLSNWQSASSSDGARDARRDTQTKRFADQVARSAAKAGEALASMRAAGTRTPEGLLRSAVAHFSERRIDVLTRALNGEDMTNLNREAFLQRELDLLLPESRSNLRKGRLEAALNSLRDTGLPDRGMTAEYNREAGAFDTLSRLDYSADAEVLLKEQKTFCEMLERDAQKLSRRLEILSRLDLEEQERYPALREGLKTALAEFRSAAEASDLADVDEHYTTFHTTKTFLDDAEASVRSAQSERILSLRTSANADDANALLDQIQNDVPIETIESHIALLRDGRSIGTYDADSPHPMEAFAPGFIDLATGEGWPKSIEGYVQAFSEDRVLAVREDRREAAEALLRAFFDMRVGVQSGQPGAQKLRILLIELGFRDASIENRTRIQSAKAWSFDLNATIQSDGTWFLPPAFGSRAKSRYRLIVADGAVLPEVLTPTLNPDLPAILLFADRLDAERRRELAARLRGSGQPAVLMDETLVAYTASQETSRLHTVFACGLPYGRVEPYLTDATRLPPEMFFGRREEIKKILSKTSDGCLVYGGRQLGKSALLSHIEQTEHNPEVGFVVVRDPVNDLGVIVDQTKEIWTRLHAKLSTCGADIVTSSSRGDADRTANDIKLWLNKNHQNRIIALFDETDQFISSETTTGFSQIIRLKDLMETTDRAFKIVFAGLHNVQRLHNVANSPLAHFGTPIVIGPLNRTPEDKRDAYDLVVEPMRAAGFRYENPETPDKILAYTNDYPSLIQEFARGLLEQLHRNRRGRTYTVGDEGPLWTIPDSMLFEHDTFGQIQENIRKKFHWTLDLDVRYALVAHTLSLLNNDGRSEEVIKRGLTAETIHEAALPYWPKTSEVLDLSAFEGFLDEMYDLGILGRIKDRNTNQTLYCLRSPEIAAMLGTWTEAFSALEKISSRDEEPRYDKATYRRSYDVHAGHRQYAPLTDLQFERLLSLDVIATRFVCGLDVLDLAKVGKALERLDEQDTMPGVKPGTKVRVHRKSQVKDFRSILNQPSRTPVDLEIAVYEDLNPITIQKLAAICDKHPRVIGGNVRPILLLDAAHAPMRDLAIRNRDRTTFLSPWGNEMLRMHLLHTEAPNDLDTPSARAQIMAATGGIPRHIVKAVEQLRTSEDRSVALNELEGLFAPPSTLRNADIIAALGPLTATDSREMYEMLDEDVKAQLGKDLHSLAPDLRAMGLLARWIEDRGILEPSPLGEFLQRTGEGRAAPQRLGLYP